MAEFAQQRFEELAPIFEQIERLVLLNKKERQKVLEDFKQHEHSIQKGSRSLDDVLQYVNFQLKVLELLKRKREENQEFRKTKEIDEALRFRINSQFGLNKRLFYNDLKYWQARINFVVGQKWYSSASKVYTELTEFVGKTHPFVWQRASDFEWDRNPIKGIDTARIIMQKGIRSEQKNLEMYLWAFELELKHAQFLHDKSEKTQQGKFGDQSINYEEEIKKCLQIANLYCKEAKNNCWKEGCTVKLYVMFNSVTNKYTVFPHLSQEILSDLEANCSSEEETYHVLAMILFNSNYINSGMSKLDKGLEVLKTVKMYTFAVNDLVSLINIQPSEEVFRKLLEILKQGQNNDKLSATCYVKWAELGLIWKCFKTEQFMSKKKKEAKRARYSSIPVEEEEDYFDDSKALEILEHALKKYPGSQEIITAKISTRMKTEHWKPSYIMGLISDIEDAEGKIDERIYKRIFMSCGMDGNEKFMKNLASNAKDPKVKTKMTVSYLKYLGLVKQDMQLVRLEFKEMEFMSSYAVSKCMADMEFQHIDQVESPASYSKFRTIMEQACNSFGENSIEPWIDFMKYEKRLEQDVEISNLRSRALKVLPTSLQQQFTLAAKSL